MTYSMDDASSDAADSERGERLLKAALSTAEQIADSFNHDHLSHELRPRLEPTLTVGGDDQPLFAFALGVALDADFDPSLYPSGSISDLIADARHRIEASALDEWDWLVSVNVLDATVDA